MMIKLVTDYWILVHTEPLTCQEYTSSRCNKYRIDTWLEGFNLLKHPWEPRKC